MRNLDGDASHLALRMPHKPGNPYHLPLLHAWRRLAAVSASGAATFQLTLPPAVDCRWADIHAQTQELDGCDHSRDIELADDRRAASKSLASACAALTVLRWRQLARLPFRGNCHLSAESSAIFDTSRASESRRPTGRVADSLGRRERSDGDDRTTYVEGDGARQRSPGSIDSRSWRSNLPSCGGCISEVSLWSRH
jgi:hypothetical protein